MIAGLLTTLFYCLLLIVDYKKGVLFSAFTIQFLAYLGCGIPGFKVFLVVVALSIVLLPFHYNKLSKQPYPKVLVFSFILFALSYFLSEYFSKLKGNTMLVIANLCSNFVFPFIVFKCIDTERDLKRAVRYLYYLMFFACSYSVFEALIGHNYILDLISSNYIMEDFIYDVSEKRFGLKRCNSIFSYFTTYGVPCVLSFAVFYALNYKYKGLTRHKHMGMLLILLLFGALATGSRAVLLGIGLTLLLLLFQKQFLLSRKSSLIILLTLFLLPGIIYYIGVLADSMINANTSKVGGSTIDLRMRQWEISWDYAKDSLWFGNGRMYIWEVVKPKHYELAGAESIWFSIFVDYGVLGAIAFLYLIYACVRVLRRINWRYTCIPLSYLLILSLSPDTGVQYNVLITFTILLYKINYKDNKKPYGKIFSHRSSL